MGPAIIADWAIMKTAPNICPPSQEMVLPISGEWGKVSSARSSSRTGTRLKDEKPKIAQTRYVGHMPQELAGAKTSDMYIAQVIGKRIRMVPVYHLNRSFSGDMIAAPRSPAPMRIPPAIPASSSVAP